MLALLAVALVLVVRFAWPRVQANLDQKSPPRIAARAIAKSLLERVDTVGPVEVSGAELRLFKGMLRLAVSEVRDGGNGAAMDHFHVLTTMADAPTASLDACILGRGDSPEQRLGSVAAAFVGVAFPPLVSRFKGEPVLGARPFWGDEPWGVPGMSGYVGAVLTRGSVDQAQFMDAPLFSDVPDLPRDGRIHLIKTIAYSKDGFWLRTVELDGQATRVADQPFAPLAPAAKPGMIVRYAVFDNLATPAVAAGRDQALERLKAREAWLFPAGDCPADLLPAAFPAFSFSSTGCRGERLLDCLLKCQHGAASFCYAAAQEIQPTALDPAAAQALFLRSCRLGYASGCTNAAAGRLQEGRPMDPCSLRTFQEVCARASDPWACAMLGGALVQGQATSRDPDRARTVLAKACAVDQDDSACQAAKAILSGLEASPAPTPPSPR
jgi:hypothetical protein